MSTVLDSLNAALHEAITINDRVVLLGEDILDPYGGAFKVTRGLSTAFPQRVLTTPVSEAGILGIATGMALRGLRPVVEVMFGDFVTLIADQLINHAAKFRWIYNDQVRVPLVVRTPMGGRRGYGPTHSQSLEKLFLGIPGLRVLAPCSLGDPGKLLLHAILDDDDPVLFIEHKLLYQLPVQKIDSMEEFQVIAFESEIPDLLMGYPDYQPAPLSPFPHSPTYLLSIRGTPPAKLTLVAYGYTAELCWLAVLKLAYEEEIFTELVIPTQLSPFNLDPVLNSTSKTGRILIVEEGSYTLGWGAEILARTVESLPSKLSAARRLAARDFPIPASAPLESAVLPGLDDILHTVKTMILINELM